jgi:hypothetical protein
MGKKSTGDKQLEEDYQIQPEKVTPTLDTSSWPLLLKVIHAPGSLSALMFAQRRICPGLCVPRESRGERLVMPTNEQSECAFTRARRHQA